MIETTSGNDAIHIASISGHALRDVTAIIDRYVARTPKIALAAIAKLERGRRERKL
jgi:hypothetical protein